MTGEITFEIAEKTAKGCNDICSTGCACERIFWLLVICATSVLLGWAAYAICKTVFTFRAKKLENETTREIIKKI